MKETVVDRNTRKRAKDENRDPITGAPGAHPVGTGIGAAGGGTAGAAVGAVIGGPVGAGIGMAVGAVAGGLVGKGAAEAIDPTAEEAYWRENYRSEPYVDRSLSYDEYGPAYRTGYEGYSNYCRTGECFDDVEPQLRSDYERRRGRSSLSWDRAKLATRAAWNKVERAMPGDADRDGK